MQPAKDLDELWEQQAKMNAMLHDDPKRILQAREFSNGVGKLIDVVKCKLAACELSSVEPEFSQLGKFKGKPTTNPRRLLASTS